MTLKPHISSLQHGIEYLSLSKAMLYLILLEEIKIWI
jgi:hypothetical protein